MLNLTVCHFPRVAALLAASALAISSCSVSDITPALPTESVLLGTGTVRQSPEDLVPVPTSSPEPSGEHLIDHRDTPTLKPPVVDGDAIRGSETHDYDIASSVTEAASGAKVVAVGNVAAWSDGRVVRDGDELLKYAVMTLQVSDTFVPGDASDALYVEVRRGGVLVDDTGVEMELEPGSQYVQRSVDELRRAVPIGTRVLILGLPAPHDDEIESDGGLRVISAWDAPTAGARLWTPLPQGLLFENADGSYVSGYADQRDVEFGQWPAATAAERPFDALVDELAATFSEAGR